MMFWALSLLASSSAVNLPNFTGYIVTAQWDGRTVPTVQWALDVTRQDTEFRTRQELKLQNLIPTTPGNAPYETYTAFDAATRQYYTAVKHNSSAASMWCTHIANDVNSSTPVGSQLTFNFPFEGALLQGLETWNNAGTVVVLAFFNDGSVLDVDPSTGQTSVFANLVDAKTNFLTTAIEMEPKAGQIYAIGQMATGVPSRFIVTLDLASKKVSSIPLAALKGHDEMVVGPFEMVWLDTLKTLMVFHTGDFDQMIYTSPASGQTTFAINSITDYCGAYGCYEFTTNDFLEDNDLWANAAVDEVNQKIYFQCSAIDPDSGEETITLCEVPIPTQIKAMDFINAAIQPMTYGYAGMEFVQAIA